MKKVAFAVLLGTGVLAGCASHPGGQVPVVDSGTSLSSGPLRDVDARQLPAEGQLEEDSVVTVMTPPEAGMPAIAADEFPSAPIQTEPGLSPISAEPVQPIRQAEVPVTTAGNAPAQTMDAPVVALLNTAQQQRGQGDLNGAASSLERAQRIAPREPQVLYRLAEIRLMQGDAAQAEQLAQRGLSYSGGRPALQAGLWDLIAEAREKQGDRQGAAEARQKARVFM